MKRLLERWYDLSIKAKSLLLMGSMLAVMWLLVAAALMQLRSFSAQADYIMNDYIDITGFLEAFSAENVWLESYIRPALDAERNYLESIDETDRRLTPLRPDWSTGDQRENALRRGIANAMDYYRYSQEGFLRMDREDEAFIDRYLSLKTQSAYIDGYARDLLYTRMDQGNLQYRAAEERNVQSMRTFVLFMLGASLLMLLLLTVFARSILQPLTALGRAAGEIGAGRYDAPPLVIRGGDEVGTASRSFNLMQAEIRRTIRALERQSEMERNLLEKEVEAVQMQKALQEGRFAQLQSQINPHFLFNTLSTIAALAREEGAPLSEDLILRLSNFFRYSLESDEKRVPLSREIQLLRDYMELQESRYGDRIAMEVEEDAACGDVQVPKFILQPLVENAILHGLRERSSGGHIRVRVRYTHRGVTITVTDNGCGFDATRPSEEGAHRSIGLRNIAERMQLAGGRLEVFSRPGLGTTARITVKEDVVCTKY